MPNSGNDTVLPVVNDTITIAPTILPGGPFQAALLLATGGANLVLSDATRTATASQVTVTGNASFLNASNAYVTGLFTTDDDGNVTDGLLILTVQGGSAGTTSWTLGISFPDLPPFLPTLSSNPAVSVLATLSFSEAAFFIANIAGATDPVTGAALSAGMSFAGNAALTGFFGAIETWVTAADSFVVAGPVVLGASVPVSASLPIYPWQSNPLPPGLFLSASIDIDYTLPGTQLNLSGAGLQMYSPLIISDSLSDADPFGSPVLAVSATLSIPSAGLGVDVVIDDPVNSSAIAINGFFSGFSIGHLADLTDIAGQGDLLGSLPTDVQSALSELSLVSAGVLLGSDFSVLAASVGIQIIGVSTGALADHTIESLVANFSIQSPFDSSNVNVTLELAGTFDLFGTLTDVTVLIPQGYVTAELPDGAQVKLSTAVAGLDLPSEIPDLDIEQLEIAFDLSGNFNFFTNLTGNPPWTIKFGPGITVSDIVASVQKTSGSFSAGFSATFQVGSDLVLTGDIAVPGGFQFVADLPQINLSDLLDALATPLENTPPDFDFSLLNNSIIVEDSTGNYALLLGTQLDTYGSAALTVQYDSNAEVWGFAFGVALETAKIAALPGLSALSGIDAAFGLEQLVLIVSSLNNPTFTFPSLSVFNNTSITSPAISSPAWSNGLTSGLSIYAMLDPANSTVLGALANVVDFTATVAASIQIPSNPDSGTTLKVMLNGNVNSNFALQNAALIAELIGEEIKIGATATITTTIGGSPVNFAILIDFDEDGVFLSGSTNDTITLSESVQLSDLALEIGCDFEGIPSLGVAAQIMDASFDSAIAIFFDSSNPAQSLFSGSISDTTLDQLLTPIVGITGDNIPAPVADFLKEFSLSGTQQFTIDPSLVDALTNREAGSLIAPFAANGITLTSNTNDLSILGTASANAWSLTDLSTLTHYYISQDTDAGTLTVEVQAQIICAPQPTQIGLLPPVKEEFIVNGQLGVFGITGSLDINIAPNLGLLIDGNLSPITLLGGQLLSITAAGDASQGPSLSVCSFTLNGIGPHATASGDINLLGLLGDSIDITISSSGAAFQFQSDDVLYSYDVQGVINGVTDFSASVQAQVTIDQTLDLGLLGNLSVDLQASASISVSMQDGTASASFSGSFQCQSVNLSFGPDTLAIDGASLANFAQSVAGSVTSAIQTYLTGDMNEWLTWITNNVIPDVAQDASQVGQALSQIYHQTADQIASVANTVLKYGASAAAEALSAANFTADVAAQALSDAGYAFNDIVEAIEEVFNDAHADTHIHVDTDIGVHGDTGEHHFDHHPGFHVDDTTPHIDAGHIDDGGHIDT